MARAGHFDLRGKTVLTPTFMPVGTHATVRHVDHSILKSQGVQVLLGNTYHLMQRPGCEVFRHFGGLHKFMNWDGLILTDSGGFQIFSLPENRRMTEEGAKFRSYYGGHEVFLSPETSIQSQTDFNSDIMMVLDECVPSTGDPVEAKRAMDLTHRWAKRSLLARKTESTQALFGIVQGAVFEHLRKESAQFLAELPFDGLAIGGLAVGEGKGEREGITEFTTPFLPHDKPRYLMGVGTPIDLLEAVHRGIDMFDCILPGAIGEQGTAYTWNGKIKLRRGVYQFDEEPLSNDCPCQTCQRHTRAYLAHLVRAGEAVGKQLISTHNVIFYTELMSRMRTAILEDRFKEFYNKWKDKLAQDDEKHPIHAPKQKKEKTPFRKLGNFQIHLNPAGHWTVKQNSSGEVIHSVNDPNLEAQELYVLQSDLSGVLESNADRDVVLWDIGLGAGFNAMAALRCAEDLSQFNPHSKHKLKMFSFENDLDAIKVALLGHRQFKHLWHPAPKILVQEGRWKNGSVDWTLLEGDFLEKINEAPAPDLIFFDPFSSKADRSCWTLETFQKIHAFSKTQGHALFTYSASTAVRATLMAAGYRVGEGQGSGPKGTTTLAWTKNFNLKLFIPLGKDWLERWERSDAKGPLVAEPTTHLDDYIKRIRSHFSD